jgi:hypothetical protein
VKAETKARNHSLQEKHNMEIYTEKTVKDAISLFQNDAMGLIASFEEKEDETSEELAFLIKIVESMNVMISILNEAKIHKRHRQNIESALIDNALEFSRFFERRGYRIAFKGQENVIPLRRR